MAIRLGSTGTFDSVVIAHPGLVKMKEIKEIKVPAAWVCAEGKHFGVLIWLRSCSSLLAEDGPFPKAVRDEAEAVFAARKDKADYVDYEFRDYEGTQSAIDIYYGEDELTVLPGTVHGFACRPNVGIPNIMAAYNAALDQTVGWFKKTLE